MARGGERAEEDNAFTTASIFGKSAISCAVCVRLFEFINASESGIPSSSMPFPLVVLVLEFARERPLRPPPPVSKFGPTPAESEEERERARASPPLGTAADIRVEEEGATEEVPEEEITDATEEEVVAKEGTRGGRNVDVTISRFSTLIGLGILVARLRTNGNA